ncbi:MAG: hypothetical protein JWO00_27 [Candidatus Parcubacteria bacterium]|nr:hypothetical protein [Candidatus Parcubacteria bacterium]
MKTLIIVAGGCELPTPDTQAMIEDTMKAASVCVLTGRNKCAYTVADKIAAQCGVSAERSDFLSQDPSDHSTKLLYFLHLENEKKTLERIQDTAIMVTTHECVKEFIFGTSLRDVHGPLEPGEALKIDWQSKTAVHCKNFRAALAA